MNVKGPDFLVVGLEKSGTHWVDALLDNHPEILCFPVPIDWKNMGKQNVTEYDKQLLGETHIFNTLASLEPNTEGKFTREISNYLTKHKKIFADVAAYEGKVPKEELYRMFFERYNDIFESQRQLQGKRLAGESTPAYIFHLDFIDSFYPNVKKICIIREPKDRIVSWYYNQLRKGRISDNEITDDFILDYCNHRIKKEYEAMLEYDGEIHCLTYEGLTYHITESVSDMLNFLQVEVSDEILKKMIEEASFEKLVAKDDGEKGRKRGENKTDSQFRKGISGDWKDHLSSKQAEMVDSILSDLQTKVFEKYNVKFYGKHE